MISPNPDAAGSPTDLQCPVCLLPLWQEPAGKQVWLWCPHGPCPDSRMNDGALADTLELAYQTLCNLAYNEPQKT